MLRRGFVALLLGVVAAVFEPAVGFFLIPSSKAVVGRAREQHHQVRRARMRAVLACASIDFPHLIQSGSHMYTFPTPTAADGRRRRGGPGHGGRAETRARGGASAHGRGGGRGGGQG